VKALTGSLGFLSTLPIGNDEAHFNSFVRNLWIMPLTGIVLGLLMFATSLLLKSAGFEELAFVSYFLIEGVNHVDGLSDFSDSIFAKDKVKALKDTKVGVGGVVATVSFVLVIYSAFETRNNLELLMKLVLAQCFAKTSMLHLLLRNEVAWEGMAKVFKENVRSRDALGYVFPAALTILFSTHYPKFLLSPILFLLATAMVEAYSRKNFGGINGDVLGATNCIVFALVVSV